MEPVSPRILTINGGSSSIKFALFEAGDRAATDSEGEIERIGMPQATLRAKGVNAGGRRLASAYGARSCRGGGRSDGLARGTRGAR